MVTGPMRPEGSSGESALKPQKELQVYFLGASLCRSPMMRFGHRLTTFTLRVFLPLCRAGVMSME